MTPSTSALPPNDKHNSRSGTPQNQLSPALSFAESFTTARDSPLTPGSDTPFSMDLIPSSSTQNLKKSISVDSFARSQPESFPVTPNGQGSLSSSPSKPSLSRRVDAASRTTFPSMNMLERVPLSSARNRGFSLSSVGDVDEYTGDSDVERRGPPNNSSDRHRHLSTKGLDQTRPTIRGGELSLPARAPALSGASQSSISSSRSASSETTTAAESLPRQHSFPSAQSLLTRPTLTNLPHNRFRSGSMGTTLPSARRISVTPTTSISVSTITCQSQSLTSSNRYPPQPQSLPFWWWGLRGPVNRQS
jgi:hypothetical protein